MTQAMSVLFPHHLGHYIGLDVHDCPGYSRGYDLKAGNCITIEPYVDSFHTLITQRCALTLSSGIYVPDDERWPAHFRGIGIRIEDSVCVGDDHPIVLTPEAVKEVGFSRFSSPKPFIDFLFRFPISRLCVARKAILYL